MVRKICIEVNATHNEQESVATKRFIGNLKNKIYKYMILVPKFSFLTN